MTALLEARNLVKSFGHLKAVDGISFTVNRGEVMGFLGPNGAGKSTTMKMLTGFLEPSAGAASIAGFDVRSAALKAKSRLGYLPEGAPLYSDMTPIDFLRFIASVRGLKGAKARDAIDQAIAATHIGAVAHQTIETLSKGFKRRVGLAQAILHDPEVLVLDEPTDGLDPNQKHEVRRLIQDMAPGKAIIISTHILEEVEALCSRALVIDRGRVVADGTPLDLKRRSRHHNAVTLELAAAMASEADRIRAVLSAIEGVAEVELSEGDPFMVTILPRDGKPVVEQVLGAVHDNGWLLKDVAVDPGRLDDVFRGLTSGEAGLETPTSGPGEQARNTGREGA